MEDAHDLIRLAFPTTHEVQSSDGKPPMILRVIPLPTSPAQEVLIGEVKRLIWWAMATITHAGAPAMQGVDGLEISLKQQSPGYGRYVPVAKLECMPLSDHRDGNREHHINLG